MSSTRKWPLRGTRTAKVGQTVKAAFKKKATSSGGGPGKLGRDYYALRCECSRLACRNLTYATVDNMKPQDLDDEKSATMDITPYKDDHGSVSKVVLEQPIMNVCPIYVSSALSDDEHRRTTSLCTKAWRDRCSPSMTVS